MLLEKEEFAKKLESLADKLSEKINNAAKDLSNAIMFLSLYCGRNKAITEDVKLKFEGLFSPQIIKKEAKFDEIGQKYYIESYDGTQNLEIIISNSYLKIEKRTENDFNNFFVEYICDKKGNFVRNAKYKNTPLDKELLLEEKSEGGINSGIYYSETSGDNFKVVILKHKDNNKKQNIYYSYSANNDDSLFYKVPEKYKKIPAINAFGMAELNDLLTRQFDEEFTRIEDQEFFDSLVKANRAYKKSGIA